ncbi:RNA methyltransferase [Candidatus Dependentiae bacterium]|nr:RNA methyltransferase [Candidatus Dependentiae bacterium]
MKIIHSLQNEEIKHLVKLQKSHYRKEQQQFLVQGYKVYMTLISCNYRPCNIYITDRDYQLHKDQLDEKLVTIVSDQIMNKISTTTTSAGLVALFAIPQSFFELSHKSVVLYDIQDPGNMGTLIRSAAAMGLKNVFIIDGCDPYGPKVVQATAGTIGFVAIIKIDWEAFLQQHVLFQRCALVVADGTAPENLDLSESIFIVGNESQGLPEFVVQNCDQRLTISMPGKTESLNAAVAGSIALYLKSTYFREEQKSE